MKRYTVKYDAKTNVIKKNVSSDVTRFRWTMFIKRACTRVTTFTKNWDSTQWLVKRWVAGIRFPPKAPRQHMFWSILRFVSKVAGNVFPGCKMAETWSWPFISTRSRCATVLESYVYISLERCRGNLICFATVYYTKESSKFTRRAGEKKSVVIFYIIYRNKEECYFVDMKWVLEEGF
jgi:hypothetical protein